MHFLCMEGAFVFWAWELIRLNSYSSIESWSENDGSETILEIPLHPLSYVVSIVWLDNEFGLDNPLILRQSGISGTLSLPTFGFFHSGIFTQFFIFSKL